ncbi:MAG TPA: chemotaxis-specific protein-glutamate methyltransferase CheB [Fimbriiglobus sp.]|jgi:chemotaxis response regulator CheB|nr:chemotaxis-specific protein-glutamate methyltransferase CheB [Fimbriiglobus sp.]
MRIAIVDDRPLALEAVRRVVARAGHDVAWTARDGEEAVRRCAADRPDLVLMDLVMPGVNGAEATRRIMASTPCPVLVVTASVSGNYGLVFEALSAGAVDAINTPVLGADGSLQGGDGLVAKIAAVERKLKGMPPPAPPPVGPTLVALGASTGGPAAVSEVLGQLSPSLPAAVLIVQHLDAEFVPGLAACLAQRSRFPVRVARAGERPEPGVALIAGRDEHLVLAADGSLAYTPQPADSPFRPSVDVLFKSLAANADRPGVGVLLTGMLRDGAEGLLSLRRAGWQTFAQDEASCVVFGMPDAAAKLGAAVHVLPPVKIGQMIAAQVRRPGATSDERRATR